MNIRSTIKNSKKHLYSAGKDRKMEELKKCPFCNGQAEVRGIKDFSGKVIIASVACKKCEASTRNYAFENAAIEAWNKRVRTSKK